MSAVIVTAFFPRTKPLPSRPILHYLRYGYELLNLGLPVILYTAPELLTVFRDFGDHVKVRHWHYHSFWARQYHNDPLPVTDNPDKDTAEYHIIQHQKTEFLEHACRYSRHNRYVWVDFGIFQIPSISTSCVQKFFDANDRDLSDRVKVPGNWHLDIPIRNDHINWHVLGGVLSCPRSRCHEVHRDIELTLAQTPFLPFEVTTWAKVARAQNWQIYPADHNASLFDNYPAEAT